MKNSLESGIAKARQASSASSTYSVPKRIQGEEAAGSIRASTGKTKSRIGAANIAYNPTPSNGFFKRSAIIGATA